MHHPHNLRNILQYLQGLDNLKDSKVRKALHLRANTSPNKLDANLPSSLRLLEDSSILNQLKLPNETHL